MNGGADTRTGPRPSRMTEFGCVQFRNDIRWQADRARNDHLHDLSISILAVRQQHDPVTIDGMDSAIRIHRVLKRITGSFIHGKRT
jgi:hypothetical protein